jgi:putative radical SAM enzyme (TIGR03279 family)
MKGGAKMSVVIKSVDPNSPCAAVGILPQSKLISINRKEILDVLDYRFYQNEKRLTLLVEADGKLKRFKIRKQEYEELGLNFETYLMDTQRACKNNCIFCFINQLPKGMRKSLYFKDDDSRLSFLFGNYITLTNITEHEIKRIIKLHISPINISVHTTNPKLRCEMMKNSTAGDALGVLYRLAKAGIEINCQLVLCPGYNDGDELERSLRDLTALKSVRSIAAVPVGLTGHREHLERLEPFNKESATAVLEIMHRIGDECLAKYGERRVFPADEFYILAEREIPNTKFYEDFLQLENGVGMWALFLEEAMQTIEEEDAALDSPRTVSIATGEAAYPLIKKLVDIVSQKWHNLNCKVYEIKNDFFGGKITVTGLVTGGDIIKNLKGKNLGERLLISENMLRNEKDKFLDDVTVNQLEEELSVKVYAVENNGAEFVKALIEG